MAATEIWLDITQPKPAPAQADVTTETNRVAHAQREIEFRAP